MYSEFRQNSFMACVWSQCEDYFVRSAGPSLHAMSFLGTCTGIRYFFFLESNNPEFITKRLIMSPPNSPFCNKHRVLSRRLDIYWRYFPKTWTSLGPEIAIKIKATLPIDCVEFFRLSRCVHRSLAIMEAWALLPAIVSKVRGQTNRNKS